MKLFWALSRTPHGLLDMATPALAALLWLGVFPPLKTIVLGIITAFAGYTAVYALNDVIDYRVDRAKVQQGGFSDAGCDLDALLVRHPMAHGYISLAEGVLWTGAWSVVALLGAYLLNPVCVVIFLAGCALEAFYCLLLAVSHWRVLVSGAVKTSGAMAAVFAVDQSPSPLFLGCLFLCLFCWEIGGQNIPNDWTDREEDRRQNAQTIPVRFDARKAARTILMALMAAVGLSLALFLLSPLPLNRLTLAAVIAGAAYLLLLPAGQLYHTTAGADAMQLFNRASHYPLFLLMVVLVHMTL